MKLSAVIGHFRTITRHRHAVIRNCAKAGILRQGLLHDLSKYSPTEFFRGARFYQGTRSPNEREREEYGYSLAWLHHKGRNRHHFEYWTDYNPVERRVVPVKMPLRYVVEMFCDRVAASKTYRKDAYRDSDPWDYYRSSKSHYLMHPNTRELLESMLKKLADEGEDAAFAYIRTEVLHNK